MSTLVTETWGQSGTCDCKVLLDQKCKEGEIDEPGPGDLRAVLSMP